MYHIIGGSTEGTLPHPANVIISKVQASAFVSICFKLIPFCSNA